MSQFFLIKMQMGVWAEDNDHGRGAVGGSGIENIVKDRVAEQRDGR